MNIGQILETALGIGRLKVSVIRSMHAEHTNLLMRGYIKEVYELVRVQFVEYWIQTLSMTKWFVWQEPTIGMPIATPVFDGAHESEIKELLEAGDFQHSGQITLV